MRAERLIADRAHYWIWRDESNPAICVREARTEHGAEMLPLHYEGWKLTHDLLGDNAPRTSQFDGTRITNELIAGKPLHQWYADEAVAGESSARLPWATFWTGLEAVWGSGRHGPVNPALTPTTLWGSWYSVPRLLEAKRFAVREAHRHPWWSAIAAWYTLNGRARGGYARVPDIARKIFTSSRTGLVLGDMHFANLVGGPERVAFVDFSEVAHAPIAIDLAPLWFEWWLSRGLLRGDDGFLLGFRTCWTEWVGPERDLVAMTDEWAKRAFPWLAYAFYRNHFELPRERATELARCTMEALGRRRRARKADRLDVWVHSVS